MISRYAIETKEQREQSQTCLNSAESRLRKNAVQTAYAFFHQKQRIYQYSTLDWQKDDIEYAIEDYVSQMDKELYAHLAEGREDYLRNHITFAEDIAKAVEKLDTMI